MKFTVLSFVVLGATAAYGRHEIEDGYNMSLWSNCSSFEEVVDTCLGCPEKAVYNARNESGVCASHTYCKGAYSTKTFATQCHVECESEWTMQDPNGPCAVEQVIVETKNTTLSSADQKELDVEYQLAKFRHLLMLCQNGECVDGRDKRSGNCSTGPYVAPVPTVPSTTAAPADTALPYKCRNCTLSMQRMWRNESDCRTMCSTNSSGDRARRLSDSFVKTYVENTAQHDSTMQRWWWNESDCDDAKITLDQIKVECDKSADTVAACTKYTGAADDYEKAVLALNDNDIDDSSASKAAVGSAMLAAAGVALLAVIV